MGIHKFTAYFTDNRFIYACVDGGNCAFKLFGNLLYAGYLSIYFETLGVMKNNIEISFGFLMLFAVAQILVNIMISIILCMPIRKISAYVLIKE